ncbi:MAG TPA: SBBP repeat-containing protein [Candidatus Sulfotelmatobacter sp.]|nr:SBBP repeat-containing protein [Candidatus Sulfotelmatobacter sp.]
MNVDRRWLRASAGRVRIFAAGLVLLAAGCAVLGWGMHSLQTTANVSVHRLPIQSAATAQPAVQDQASVPSLLQAAQFSPRGATPQSQERARALLAGLPLVFEPNQGQGNLDSADSRAKFVSRGPGYSLFLGSEGAILSLASHQPSKPSRHASTRQPASSDRIEFLQMKLAGANANPTLTGSNPLPGKSNYFLGNDPAKWRSRVPQFARVRYENIYPGINLLFYGNQGRLEYDFQVEPGSDPRQAELEFNGAQGLQVKDGALIIKGQSGSMRLEAPRVYQEIAGKQQPVEGSFVLRGGKRAGFAIGSYDHSRELVIDPILTFSTYFGGTNDEHSSYIAIDGSFNIYLTGSTQSPNLPTVSGSFQRTLSGTQNVYVAKIAPPLGSIPAALDYITYLGGNGTDSPAGISVDGSGNAYLAGTTSSTNFPSTSLAYQKAPATGSTGTSHVFVTELKYDATSLIYSSYLSGNGTDVASGMTIDTAGYIYVTGTTTSNDVASFTDQFPASTLPQALPYQISPRAAIQFFVTKVDTAAGGPSSIAYSTYFGGANFDTATPIAVGGNIAVDTNRNIYFTGTTNFLYSGCAGCSNTDFPILNPYQPCLDQVPPTVIVTAPQCTYPTGASAPTESDAFVAKLNPNVSQGQQLVWSTYLGGTGTDSGTGIGLDPGAANVYVTGTTNSTDIGTSVTTLSTSSAYQRCLDTPVNPQPSTVACPTPATTPYPTDAFVARLTNPSTTSTTTTTLISVALNYFSFLGGTANDAGQALTVDLASGALVTGWTQSPDLLVLNNSIQSALNCPSGAATPCQDAFVARLNTATVVGQTTGSWVTYFGGSGTDQGTSIVLDVNQNGYFAGDTNSIDFPVSKPLQPTNGGGYDAFVTQLGTAVSLSVNGALTLGTNQTYISAGNQATFTYTVTNSGPDLANNITVLNNLNPSITGVPLTFVSASTSAGTCGGGSTNAVVSCSLPSLQAGSTATVTVVVTPTASSNGQPGSFNGGSVQVTGPGNIVLAQTSVPAQMSDFSLLVTPSNNSVPVAGDTAQYQVQLTPHPVYGTDISLACSGLPAASSCNFTSNPVSLQGPGASTLNITTTIRPIVTGSVIFLTRRYYAIWLSLPGLSLLGVSFGGRRRRIAGGLFLCVTFALLLLLPACGSTPVQAPVSGTPPGNYTITVTATSGSDTKSQTIVLTVP